MGSLLCGILVVWMIMGVVSNMDKDRAECGEQLMGLASCLPYVGGNKDAKSPSIDCCSGIKQVVVESMKCLCILIKDRNDPNLGLKINVSLALQLPSACHAPSNLTKCIDVLHLTSTSPDAKLFEEFGSSNTSSASTPPKAKENSTSDGGTERGLQSVCGVIILVTLLLGLSSDQLV